MEIMANTNNHNQKELRLYVPNEQQTTNSTQLTSGGARSPFQREVREWQRIDPDTGALLTGRLEADRWINGPLNKYGKISDSQNISQPNGTQQTQRKQLEVLQTCTAAGGALQVIRQTTSSRWSTSSASASPLLLSANTSPIPQPVNRKNHNNNNSKHSFKQKTHTANNTSNTKNTIISSSSSPTSTPFIANTTALLTNGFNHKPHHQQHHFDQLQQQQQTPQEKLQQQQYPYSLVNGISSSSRNRNWPDLTESISTLDICDNDHDNEHDHDNDYIVHEQHSTDDDHQSDDNDNEHDDDSLNEDTNDRNHYLLNKRNNLKNVDFSKRHSFTVFTNSNDDHDSHNHHHYNPHHNISHSNNNLSRDSSSGSCSNNNQLFLLDTAPSLKLSNLMKSSSSLSNSSNNSTTASQATTNPTSMNTHKSMATTANKISLHAIVGSGNSNNNMTTTSSTPSPTTTTRPSWQQPTLYRQNSHNNNNNNSSNNLMKSRVGDNSTNNCCSSSNHSSSSDESRSYIGKTETDLRHLQQQQRQSLSSSSSSPNHYQQQQQQQIHFKQNDRLTPTHLPHSYHRVDLESFRHYNNNDNNNNDAVAAADDDGLRLSSRHLRRQQTPNEPITTTTLQRSRSISTDDLSTEWDIQGVDSEEPAEWRRVSKLRRSFQSSTKTNQSYSSPLTTRRPLDLPTNSVSVSKIRAELENGRRLNTVMRNNHVDLAALSSILNGNADKECKSPSTAKRSSFLTAESLKEIRGKLKKLSDESLYKEDFLIKQPNNDANPVVEHIVNDQTKLKRNYEKSPERYRVTNQSEEVNSKHTTNSLESRLKYRDTNSTDWHIRRKSYGFEKMSPPEKAMLRMDASTDSGLGRSGELQNWSPTSEAAAANRTVVHFGESTKVAAVPAVQRRYRPQKSQEESENSPEEDSAVSKRHSIAVDESQYVKDNSRQTTQIHLNGFYEPGNYSKLIHSSESTTTNDRGQQKRVEFSKTEVHFATESGRVNIVETDSKPPPTNNFRRRRSRSSSVGPLQSLVKSATTVNTTTTTSNSSVVASSVAMPVTLFGDDNSKKKTIASTTVAYRAPLVGSPEPKDINGINVTVTLPSNNDTFNYNESSRSSYASTSGVDTTDCDTDEMTSLRGILKNKPAKPKPYVLGENIDKPDDLWGVQLKPVNNITKTERVYKSESPPLMNSLSQKSVAERIQELGSAASTQSNGFSTKINVSLGNNAAANNNWEETDLPKSNVMSIKLHSPQASNELQPPLKVVPPIAKPRIITKIQESQPPKLHNATTVKQTPYQTSLPTKDSLKIIKEARGARQLREHELSYFGVPLSTSEDEKPKSKYTTNTNFRNSPKRSLPLRKLSDEESSFAKGSHEEGEQWQLESDKPDLLKHNAIEVKPAERKSLKKKAELDEEDEHLYENIANELTPVFKVKAGSPTEQYDRKMDLKRDAMILSEMNKTADQTLKDISDEAALKDRRRRSLQRRNSKPLETIDEKSIAERINDTCIAVKISRGTYSSEAKKTSRHSTPSPSNIKSSSRERTSSQSSVECCPRARSRSLSSEKEYDNAKAKPSRSTQIVKHKAQKPSQSRSSSLDSQRSAHSQYSSGEEQQQPVRSAGSFRREDRSRTKTKRITSSTSSITRDKHRDEKTNTKATSHQQHHHHHGDSKRLSSTTHSSSTRERVECKPDNANGSSSHKHHNSSSGLQRSTAISSSGRRQREDLRDSQRIKRSTATTASGRSTSERHDKHDQTSSKHATRSVRGDDERNSAHRSSSHRLERGDKENGKSSSSRSTKDLLLLGLLIMGATQPTNLHKRFRSLQSFHIQTSP
ncbi:probable serine/threonine-protein kinase DDB_G0282963 isoform X5 [Lucilia cuprina]|uniref:probable serine/threonine-protein kinase DDB_G0282963 isoform X5 n=1 Tax=Lucilia cuprina TaxID=7375 RepID=UPI001F06E7D8|nr:probable serine/threonine-protein kinase DDB_G0282963 isoform X5 [Lucilia cuprina]